MRFNDSNGDLTIWTSFYGHKWLMWSVRMQQWCKMKKWDFELECYAQMCKMVQLGIKPSKWRFKDVISLWTSVFE